MVYSQHPSIMKKTTCFLALTGILFVMAIVTFSTGKSQGFLAFDAIDNDLFCLGSWFGINNKALAIRK